MPIFFLVLQAVIDFGFFVPITRHTYPIRLIRYSDEPVKKHEDDFKERVYWLLLAGSHIHI